MLLTHCTLTGADDAVDPAALVALAKTHPFVEWGVLFSPKHVGTARYPSHAWIDKFLDVAPEARKAAHLCGGALQQFIDGDPALMALLSGFARIQLNFNARHTQVSVPALLHRVEACPDWAYITQYHADNASLPAIFTRVTRHGVLFDASGGRGVTPGCWPAPLPGLVCGYAGGLGPDNLAEALREVTTKIGSGRAWVDMESGVRDVRDAFDLAKVERCLALAAPYA